jgi:formamidopyrimidine-DNA glycosylase
VPELPEVETVARTLRPRLVGRTVRSVSLSGLPLRRPLDRHALARLVGARVDSVERVGKYLVAALDNGRSLVAHLGMTGRLVVTRAGDPPPRHTHARLELDDGCELRFIDPRRFGVLAVYPSGEVARSPELSVLGLDPLDARFTPEALYALLHATRRDLKSFLLDQSRVAGLGNIYAAEALFVARLSPRRKAHRLSREAALRLHAAIRAVLEAAIRNRGTSLSDYVDADGVGGENQHALAVYARAGEPCPVCGRAIRRLVQGARSTFYCPGCQK